MALDVASGGGIDPNRGIVSGFAASGVVLFRTASATMTIMFIFIHILVFRVMMMAATIMVTSASASAVLGILFLALLSVVIVIVVVVVVCVLRSEASLAALRVVLAALFVVPWRITLRRHLGMRT